MNVETFNARERGLGVPKTGTSIVACKFDGGVVLGTDTRVCTGIYIYNRSSKKIASLSDSVFMLRSGNAPDTEQIGDHIRLILNQI